jgi:ABC-type sugar transport system permease subunit
VEEKMSVNHQLLSKEKKLNVNNQTLVKRKRLNSEAIHGYLFILPTMVAFIIFILVPSLSIFALSLFKWDLLSAPKFLGLENYTRMFTSSEFWHVLWVTTKYVLYSQPPKIVLALFVAVLLNRSLKGTKWFRIPIILPWIVMPIGVAIVWKWILAPTSGMLNYYLDVIGLSKIPWFSPSNVLQSIAIIDVWQFFGFTAILFLLGLQNIPRMYYEAASIDGANNLRAFWHITLPLLKPTLLFVLIISVIGSFQVFDIVYATTGGGPGDLSKVYNFMIYEKAFQNLDMGYASALSVILFIVLMIMTFVQMRLIKDGTHN